MSGADLVWELSSDEAVVRVIAAGDERAQPPRAWLSPEDDGDELSHRPLHRAHAEAALYGAYQIL